MHNVIVSICLLLCFPVSASILLPFSSIYPAISTETFSRNCWRKWTDVEKCVSCSSGSRIFHSSHPTAAHHSPRQVSTDFNGLHLESESVSLLIRAITHRYTHCTVCYILCVLVFHPHTTGTLPNTAPTHGIIHTLMHSHLHRHIVLCE